MFSYDELFLLWCTVSCAIDDMKEHCLHCCDCCKEKSEKLLTDLVCLETKILELQILAEYEKE